MALAFVGASVERTIGGRKRFDNRNLQRQEFRFFQLTGQWLLRSMLLDIEQLSTLVAFADTGSVKGAASLVHKTPSAVSVQLSKLGETVKRELLRRQGRRLVVTHDGAELVGHARRLLADTRSALDT